MSQSLELLSLKIVKAIAGAARTALRLKKPRHLVRFCLAITSSLLIPMALVPPLGAQSEAAGDLDPSFGLGGVVTTDLGGIEEARDLAIQRDGKIVAAGMIYVGSKVDLALARYNVDGSLDATFGDGGVVRTGLGAADTASAIALQADDKIVVAGSTSAYPNSSFALARYDVAGHLDPSFGGRTTSPGFMGYRSRVHLSKSIQPHRPHGKGSQARTLAIACASSRRNLAQPGGGQ